jgi:signal-transduction protein with cAMP-binding, CBS, and nucleotidyltransferase domain
MKKTPRDVGSSTTSGIVKVADLMTGEVMSVTRHQSVGRVRELLAKHGIHSLPVVNAEREPLGIVTSMDLLDTVADSTLVGEIMTRDVVTVPKYADVHVAARMMRNHRIHHLVVTERNEVVGLLSSFDLLRLIENRRFVAKNLPSRPQKGGGQRRRDEENGVRSQD